MMENKYDGSNSNKLLFEFIVDQQQFIKQITTDNGKINLDLISQFLNQFLSSTKDFYNGEEIMDLDLLETSLENEYKMKVLKNLAIKIAAHIKFDLNTLHSSLSVVILNTLLIEFFKLYYDKTLSTMDEINFQMTSPPALFALALYHRWCLKLIVEDGLLKKPTKIPNIQFPNDPINSIMGTKESIIKKIKERQHISINILEKFLSQHPPVSVIQSECIIFDENRTLKYDWSKAFEIKQNEHLSLIAYDLGCIYFYNRKFDQAYTAFKVANEKIQRASIGYFPCPDIASLEGYLKVTSSSAVAHYPVTLFEKVQESLRTNFLGLTGLLLEDIIRRELDLSFRVCLQEQAMNAKRQDSLYEEIVVCNSIRDALEGRVVCCKLINILTFTKGIIDFFLKVCVDVYLCISDADRRNLKLFLRFLTTALSPELNFVSLMLASPLNEMFLNIDFVDNYESEAFDAVKLSATHFPSPLYNMKSDEENLFSWEQDILNTNDVEQITNIIHQIVSQHRDYYFESLAKKLHLSDGWNGWLDRLPKIHPSFKLLIQILIYKSKICFRRMDFETSWNLLQYLDLQICQSIENCNHYVIRIRLTILRVGLAAANQKPPIYMPGSGAQDLACRCKFFVKNLDYDLQADEILFEIIAFLISNNEFQFLSSLSAFTHNIIQIGVKLSYVLQDLGQINVLRSVPKDFICFLRDLCVKTDMKELMQKFVDKIKNEIVFTVLISAFAKLHIISDSKVSYQIFTEFATIWPTTLPVVSYTLSGETIFNTLNYIINSALKFNSRQLSWIRSQADLLHSLKDFDRALKYYVQLLTIITNYFCEPIPNNALTESVIKKMIYCCDQIGYNTQAAVLCQFLEEINYQTLFSNLQTKQICDAMDDYYQFFWDITILEFLVNLHLKRGEVGKKNYCTKLIGELELNSSNPFEISAEVSRARKMRFMRCLVKQYITQPSQLLSIDSI